MSYNSFNKNEIVEKEKGFIQMTKYMYDGDIVMMRSDLSMNVQDKLEAGTYLIETNPNNGEMYLRRRSDMSIPKKIYGDTEQRAERILNTSNVRHGSTGILLAGEKGSGKTLLGKILSHKARIEHDIPTIVINSAYCGDGFNKFIAQIDQPCVIFFDEFEKVYADQETQDRLLTLLDGTYTSQKIFVLTTNDKYRINKHMQNRPGRLFYMLEYSGLDQDFVREYCQDNINNKEYIETVVKLTIVFSDFNFDMLQALVEEMNRYNEHPKESLKWLNIAIVNSSDRAVETYDVSVIQNGVEVSLHSFGKKLRYSIMHETELIYHENDFFNKNGHDNEAYKKLPEKMSTYNYVDAHNSESYLDNAIDCLTKEDEDEENLLDLVYDNAKRVMLSLENVKEINGDTIILANDNVEVHLKRSYANNNHNGIPDSIF